MIRTVIAAVVGVGVLVLGLVLAIGAAAPQQHGVAIAPSAAPAPVVARQSTASIGIDDGWLDATSAAIRVPRVALDAYALAATAQREATPACGLGWNTLAGLGYAESAHGTLGGAHLDDDGRLVGSILGPLLDGTRYAAVPDTDGGVLDGSVTWDRAVGPLQFLPATWAASALDGDADGVTDPNDVYDAARTAAAYLCSGGRSMGTGAAWAAGIRSYNPNDSYVDEVLAAANRYATAAG